MQAEISAFLASLESQSSYSQSTRLAYGTDLWLFFNYLRDTLQRSPALIDFDSLKIADFLETERQQGLRLSTLLRRRASLQRFERYLKQEGHLQEDRVSSKLSLIDKSTFGPKEHIHCLTPAEVKVIREELQTSKRPLSIRDYAILVLLLETGLAVSNLVSLNLSDIDLYAGCFRLETFDKQDYWVSMGASREPIRQYIVDGRPELNPAPSEPALFISQNGIRMSRQSIWQILHNLGESTGLPAQLSPRLIRHTAALNMFRKGRPISEIQRLLGHSNPLSTNALLHRLALINPHDEV
jgi:site-specific recombinase XerD